MENGDIVDDQITASSFYPGDGGFEAWKGRLNNNADFWSPLDQNEKDPWIQVDLLRSTMVTGIITQGSSQAEQGWVTDLQIQYGDSEHKLMYIFEDDQPKVSIPYYLF